MSDIFMDCLPMDTQIGFLCGLVVTLRTREPNSVMHVSFVDLYIFSCFAFMITFASFKCFSTIVLDVGIKKSLAVLGGVTI